MESILPGIGNLTKTATGNIGDLLSGLPSPGLARTTNAYWGVGAGQPATSGVGSFIGQRGADIYGQQAQQSQQAGLQDLLSLVGGMSAPALQNQGQQLQSQEFNQGSILDLFKIMLSQNGQQPEENVKLYAA